jgi:hypothetical protein
LPRNFARTVWPGLCQFRNSDFSERQAAQNM